MLDTHCSEVDLQPLQFNVDTGVNAISKAEANCLAEIRAVLAKNKNIDRFGISLIHHDFELSDDEIMLETTDEAKREHWIRPVKKAILLEQGMEAQTTIVRFDKSGWSQHCSCAQNIHGHTGGHMG